MDTEDSPNCRRTLTYLKAGDLYGLEELYGEWSSGSGVPLKTSLRGVGYVDVLRIPTRVLFDHVFPQMKEPVFLVDSMAQRPLEDASLLEWAVEDRLINGDRAMLIDMELCVRCDDCVVACATAHGGNPRFRRQGKAHGKWMVTNACMHCIDPVCMIGCPTGAIHRNATGGEVVINEPTCIGCGTCASSCPYDNIVMVGIHDLDGAPLLDEVSAEPILKATKCDLALDRPGDPPCVRACSQGALLRTSIAGLVGSRRSEGKS